LGESRYVSTLNKGTENITAKTKMITLLVVKSDNFFPTFDSSGNLKSAGGPDDYV
jgi:hypothetical protein